MRNIVLIGMPTSGKTTFGGLLNEVTGRPLIEMDDEIIRRMGMTIPEAFREKGEEFFRDAETETAKALQDVTGHIVSCGGGVVKREENMQCLRKNGFVIWLDRDPSLLFGSAERPLASDKEQIRRLYAERLPLYERYADVRVKNNGTIEECLEKMLEVIREAEEADGCADR